MSEKIPTYLVSEKVNRLRLPIPDTYRSDGESKAIKTLKSTKESPSGGEKLLRLLASGGASDAAKTSDTQAMNNVSLNFAQGSFINNIFVCL